MPRPGGSRARRAPARGDVYVTELQPEVVEINSGVPCAVPPRYTIDTDHTPGCAAGYLANQVSPRVFLTTHMNFDPFLNEETVAEVRQHWKGPSHPMASWST